MSGRGKGGKGFGKGGAKLHRKVLRDSIQGITKPTIRRLARRGGEVLSRKLHQQTPNEVLKRTLSKRTQTSYFSVGRISRFLRAATLFGGGPQVTQGQCYKVSRFLGSSFSMVLVGTFVPFATSEPQLGKFSGRENFSSGSKRHVAR